MVFTHRHGISYQRDSISVFSQHFPQFEQRTRSRLSNYHNKKIAVIVVLVAPGEIRTPAKHIWYAFLPVNLGGGPTPRTIHK